MIHEVLASLEQWGADALVLDGRRPLLAMSTPADELLMYHMDEKDWPRVRDTYRRLSACDVDVNTECRCLSGGQQLMLGISIALCSAATRVVLSFCLGPLHEERRELLRALIGERQSAGMEVVLLG